MFYCDFLGVTPHVQLMKKNSHVHTHRWPFLKIVSIYLFPPLLLASDVAVEKAENSDAPLEMTFAFAYLCYLFGMQSLATVVSFNFPYKQLIKQKTSLIKLGMPILICLPSLYGWLLGRNLNLLAHISKSMYNLVISLSNIPFLFFLLNYWLLFC